MNNPKIIQFPFGIRVKVILPYLILTLAVAIIGAYVVTKLVANSLGERLTNQLLEAGRVVSDSIIRQEIKHLEIARIIAYTRGLGEALTNSDIETIHALAKPVAIGMGTENLIIINNNGAEVLHLLVQIDGTTLVLAQDTGAGSMSMIQDLLASTDTGEPPRRSLGQHPSDQKYFYYSAVPVFWNDAVAGVVMIGTALNSLLPELKNTALADITIYTHEGRAILTSLASVGGENELLAALSIPPQTYDQIISTPNTVSGKSISVYGRQYSLAWGPIRVGKERIGVFAVALPLNFVLQAGTTSRNTYAFLFTAATMGVVMIGYSIARMITGPLNSLVQTSQAIASGNLEKRTGIRSEDEFGLLAETFDEMTDRLADRTNELEKAYQALEQMDRTKISFINVAAHELRSPLTLIKGYSQMLTQKGSTDPSLEALSQGISNGTQRMMDIVNNMLDVSRIDSQTLKIIPEVVDLTSIMDQVQQELHSGIVGRNISFVKDELNDLPNIIADPDLIRKVFYHLVTNAIKYTPDGGVIKVTSRVIVPDSKRPEVEIAICDTGIGIDPKHHQLIFEKFFQTGEVNFHSTGRTKFKGGGPGLGLAIARGIVDAHGGRIWVESPGYDEINLPGSRFIIHLPIHGVER